MTNAVIVLILVALVAIVSVQNAMPVAVTFLFWKIETPLFVVIVLSILAGILIAVVAVISAYVKKRLVKDGKSSTSPGK
jgi:uncharacterized integral membrane protein